MRNIDINGNLHDRLGRFTTNNTPAAMFDLSASLFGEPDEQGPTSAPGKPATAGPTLIYDPQAKTLTVGRKDCPACKDQPIQGLRPAVRRCPSCDGSGLRTTRDARSCAACSGAGHLKDPEKMLPCKACGGAYRQAVEADFNDPAPAEAIADLPIRVTRTRHQGRTTTTTPTALLTINDGGEQWDRDDPDALLADVRRQLATSTRAADIIEPHTLDDKTARIVPGLTVEVTSTGYTVRSSTQPRRPTPSTSPTRAGGPS